MITGRGLYQLWSQGVDSAYTGFLDAVKFDRYITEAFIQSQQEVYKNGLGNQSGVDEMSYFLMLNKNISLSQGNTFYHSPIPIQDINIIGTAGAITTQIPHGLEINDIITINSAQGVTGVNDINLTVLNTTPTVITVIFPVAPTGTYVVRTGVVNSPRAVNDYYHYLFAEATFDNPTNFLCHGTNTTPARLELNKRTSLRSGDEIKVAGFNTGNLNEDFFVKFLNDKLLALYSDKKLTQPITGTGVTGVGNITQIITSELKYKFSDQRGSIFGKPNVLSPFFQIGNLQFIVYPDDTLCSNVKMDYIRKMPFPIDATNDTDDLLKYYRDYFLYNIKDRAIVLFSNSMRDMAETELVTPQIIQNP